MPILFKSLRFLRKNYVTHCNILLYIIIAVRLSGGQSRSSERRSRTLRAAGAVPTAILDRRSLLRVRKRRWSGRRDGHWSNRRIETGADVIDYLALFGTHQISWVGYRAPATVVPVFGAHQIECARLGWAIRQSLLFRRNK